jgi:hypothetical protein
MNDTASLTVRALLIDPLTKSVSEVQLPIDEEGDTRLDAMREHLQCQWVTRCGLGPAPDRRTEVDLWLDDEGRLSYPNPRGYFGFKHPTTGEPIGDLFCGRGLILSGDPGTGLTTGTTLPVCEIAPRIYFLDDPPPEEAVEPVCYVTSWQ